MGEGKKRQSVVRVCNGGTGRGARDGLAKQLVPRIPSRGACRVLLPCIIYELSSVVSSSWEPRPTRTHNRGTPSPLQGKWRLQTWPSSFRDSFSLYSTRTAKLLSYRYVTILSYCKKFLDSGHPGDLAVWTLTMLVAYQYTADVYQNLCF